MPTTIEDRLVVGDASVVVDLYHCHGPFIHTINRQLVGAAADRLTTKIFVDAWHDRLDFNPSLGTVRNWLVRRVRGSVSRTTDGADTIVDQLVVADSLARMDQIRRIVLIAAAEATDVDVLATELDLPVASVNGHLRRGTDALKLDLADSRIDGGHDGLEQLLSPDVAGVTFDDPPPEIWAAVVAELGLAEVDVTRAEPAPEAQPEFVPEPTAPPSPAPEPSIDLAADEFEQPPTLLEQSPTQLEQSPSMLFPDPDPALVADPAPLPITDDAVLTADVDPEDLALAGDHGGWAGYVADTAPGDGRNPFASPSTAESRRLWQNPVAVVAILIVLGVIVAIVF